MPDRNPKVALVGREFALECFCRSSLLDKVHAQRLADRRLRESIPQKFLASWSPSHICILIAACKAALPPGYLPPPTSGVPGVPGRGTRPRARGMDIHFQHTTSQAGAFAAVAGHCICTVRPDLSCCGLDRRGIIVTDLPLSHFLSQMNPLALAACRM